MRIIYLVYLGIFSKNDTVYFSVTTVDRNGSAIDATTGPTYEVRKLSQSTTISSGTMSKVGSKTGVYTANFDCTSSSYKPGQFFIDISATVDSQTPTVTLTFQLVSDQQSIEETFSTIKTLAQTFGEGSVSIDHNYGGTDTYRVISSGTPVAGVAIRVFAKTDYDNGRRANNYVIAQTSTKSDGRWKNILRLDPGNYVLEFSKKSAFQTYTVNLTVS